MQRSRVVLRPRHTSDASLSGAKRTWGMVPLLPPAMCGAKAHRGASGTPTLPVWYPPNWDA